MSPDYLQENYLALLLLLCKIYVFEIFKMVDFCHIAKY